MLLPFRAAVLAAGILMSAAAVASAQGLVIVPPENQSWRTVIYPVRAWLPIFGANVQLPEQPGGGTPSLETSGNLNYAALSGFRVERWRVALDGEFLWAGLSASAASPRFHLGVTTDEFKLTGGLEVAPALYLAGGFRYMDLDVDASLQDYPEMHWKPSFWEPIVGATFRPHLSKNIRIFSRGDFGWSANNSHRSTTATATIEWQFVPHVLLGAGYGVAYVRADGTLEGKPVHAAQTLHGPTLTIGIRF